MYMYVKNALAIVWCCYWRTTAWERQESIWQSISVRPCPHMGVALLLIITSSRLQASFWFGPSSNLGNVSFIVNVMPTCICNPKYSHLNFMYSALLLSPDLFIGYTMGILQWPPELHPCCFIFFCIVLWKTFIPH